MKRIITTFHHAIILFATFSPLTGCATSSAIFKVRVVDDDNKPIKNVHSRFINIFDYGENRTGITDINGIFFNEIKNIFEVYGYFEKPGYYKTSGVIWRASVQESLPSPGVIYTNVLKRIIDPVPMILKDISTYPPRQDEPIGFDLEIGDWVFPDGKGKITDLLVTAQGVRTSLSVFSYSLSVEFLGENNGFIFIYSPPKDTGSLLKSELLPPQIAPETGYEKIINHFARQSPEEHRPTSTRDNTRRLIFRVRTEVDENGKIVSANYGWSNNDLYIAIKPNGKGITGFSLDYYYNPDSQSRSLEPKEIADKQIKELPGGEK